MDDLPNKYANQTFAEAVFSTNEDGVFRSFRFELITKGWELSDGDRIGKVIDGTFYYDDDLDKILLTNTRGGYYVDRVHSGGVTYSLITFYKRGSTVDKLGEFYSRDPHNVVSSSGIYQQKGRFGLWQKTNYACSTATVNKLASSTEFIMNCPSLNKKATFHCNQKSDKKLYESAVQNIGGNLVVKDIDKIVEAKTVKWTPRDLVFYPDTDKALSGFFYGEHIFIAVKIYWSSGPVDSSSPKKILGEDNTGKEQIKFNDVNWG